MKTLTILLLIVINCYSQDDIQRMILDEINNARMNPCAYGLANTGNAFLCEVNPIYKLKFSKTISDMCFDHCKTMMEEGFGHSTNDDYHNESIFFGNIKKCVILLIIDDPNEDNLDKQYGHRKHLLGMKPITADDIEIGIGYLKYRNRYFVTIKTR